MKDDRSRAERLLGANLAFIEHFLAAHTFCVGSDGTIVFLELYFTGDFAGVRTIEDNICGCPPQAMYAVPTVGDVCTLSASSKSHLRHMRSSLHSP
eukprot:1900296-Pleurochrysis_carterae.AAC.1